MKNFEDAAQVIQNPGEVQVVFPRAISLNMVQENVESCQDGQCACHDTGLYEAIDSMQVEERDGQVHLILTGDKVSAQAVQECMQSCGPDESSQKAPAKSGT